MVFMLTIFIRVLVLERLTDDNITRIQKDAIGRVKTNSLPEDLPPGILLPTDDIIKYITSLSIGDARTALNLLELVLQAPSGTTPESVIESLKNTTMSRHV